MGGSLYEVSKLSLCVSKWTSDFSATTICEMLMGLRVSEGGLVGVVVSRTWMKREQY